LKVHALGGMTASRRKNIPRGFFSLTVSPSDTYF
jgi:hypothetical protein